MKRDWLPARSVSNYRLYSDEAALEVCRQHEESGRCGVIDSISASARGPRSRSRPWIP